MERVRCGELDGYPTVVGFGSGDRQGCLSPDSPMMVVV
jgi:hypothetical protein